MLIHQPPAADELVFSGIGGGELTCGANGSWLFTPDAVSFKPTPKVEVADAVGAGDSFTAAFTATILGGKTIDEAHELAVKLSAFVCTQHGAMPLHPESL